MSRKGPTTTKNSNGTVHGDRGNEVLSQDASRLYKTQDLGYVRTMRNKTAKEVEQLEEGVVGIKGSGKKVVWVDDEEDLNEVLGDDDEDMDDEDDEDAGEVKVDVEARKLKKRQEKEAIKQEARLSLARERLKALTEAEEALQLQRAKMNKSPSVGGINKHGVKFKVRERKR